jgi:hypothetical protein
MTMDLGDAQLVTFVAAGDPPQVIDVAVAVHDLDPGDPRQPGDIIVHDGDLDREAFAAGLEAAAAMLRGAT